MADLRRHLGADGDDLAWADLNRRLKYSGNMWYEVRNTIGAGTHDQNAERQYLDVLLEFKVAVERYKYLANVVRAAK